MARVRGPNDKKIRSSKVAKNIDNARGSNLRNDLGRVNNNDYEGVIINENNNDYEGNATFVDKKTNGTGNVNVGTDKTKEKKIIQNISDPNALFKYASYNYLFTLSALSQDEIKFPSDFFGSAPHDIIARSSGIGADADQSIDRVNPGNFEAIATNPRAQRASENARRILKQNRDVYINNVNIENTPPYNEQRRLTSVTQLTMEISEPYGLTLIDKIRGAALNNGFLDHLDAPFLLQIDFTGFDENGKVMKDPEAKNLQRKIPIKITGVDISIQAGGAQYTVTAVPYNEFGFFNNFSYLRTTASLTVPLESRVKDVLKAFELILNNMTTDEQKRKLVEFKDKYVITMDPKCFPEEKLDKDLLKQFDLLDQEEVTFSPHRRGSATQTREARINFAKLKDKDNVIKVLENIMKCNRKMNFLKYEDFRSKLNAKGDDAKLNYLQGFDPTDEKFYYTYFKIETTIIPDIDQFDRKRGKNPKIITYHISPFKLHAMTYARPGIPVGKGMEPFVYKTYNYIFTGENVDIINLDLNYKYAYYLSKLKDVDGDPNDATASQGTSTGDDVYEGDKKFFTDGNMHLTEELSTAKSEGAGPTLATDREFESYLDRISNPTADMVDIQLQILGDPAWLGQSQYIMPGYKNNGDGTAVKIRTNVYSGGADNIWDPVRRCYNPERGMPVVQLNFKTPSDVEDKTGVYEMPKGQAEFNGLYRVYKVINEFNEGAYTSTLHMARFNEQGIEVGDPVVEKTLISVDGQVAGTTNREKAINLFAALAKGGKIDLGRIKQEIFRGIAGKVQEGISRIFKT